ncbi:6-phosphofructokinase [Ornithinimicrobium kibberense]|uniref:6-phosphofructokinase n=1 Tax=Ornithinimicrobium kibberense TaxID=282060 RepID=A0ABV5V6N7_9MICO|nr:6-phosphofructokinase [Ornithinimicrobium kibberense]
MSSVEPLLTPQPADEAGPGPRIGILTSGGDSPGMNAAVRAVVRSTLRLGGRPFGILEGWRGALAGGDGIRELGWDDVGNLLHRGGTVLGSARCPEFRERSGLRAAALHLTRHGIDRLVVIGGDGSLRGAEELRQEWPSLQAELVEAGELAPDEADAHPRLRVAGLVGSIDNDMAGTDMTIGADTALHRIIEALDALSSTAASHQRTFVVEVMGRHCGYLALMAAVAGGSDAVLLPEGPPADGWQSELVASIERTRATGQRDSLVVVAEGATDQAGRPITSADVAEALGERMGERARVTILGHVQRGGRPSAYDRWMPTLLGYAAVRQLVHAPAGTPSQIVGVRHNEVAVIPLSDAVRDTNAVKTALETCDFDAARAARGSSFATLSRLYAQLSQPPVDLVDGLPHTSRAFTGGAAASAGDRSGPRPRIGVLHVGGLAPGMNSAVRALVRFGLTDGSDVLGIEDSLDGLVRGRVRELGWAEVDDWVGRGGAFLGTRRHVPTAAELPALAEAVARHQLDALVLVGGLDAYRAAAVLAGGAAEHEALRVPVVCLPATIDNNLPGADLSVGADSALNTIVESLDRIRTSASATQRCFVAETKGGGCGYLTMMAGLASGSERVYLPEDRLRIADVAADAERMSRSFAEGRRLYLVLRNEMASAHYTTDLVARIFEEEGGDLFDVRSTVLGHVQDGGDPTPFDRLLATRLARLALDEVARQRTEGAPGACYVGEVAGRATVTPVDRLDDQVDLVVGRALDPWWAGLRPVIAVVSDRHRSVPPVDLPRTASWGTAG